MTDVRLDAGDAAGLAELLQFLAEWLARESLFGRGTAE